MFTCKFCQKECKNSNSFINHERCCKSNPLRQATWLEKNMGSWTRVNQYTKPGSTWTHSPESRKKMSEKSLGRKHTEEHKKYMSEIAHRRELGGHTSKRRMEYVCKDGSVVILQSSYEIRLAQILDDVGITWERPPYMLWKDAVGVNHRYYADFKVGDVYLDTKNSYLATKDAEKIKQVKEQNAVDLRVVLEHEINKETMLLWLSGDSTCLVSRNSNTPGSSPGGSTNNSSDSGSIPSRGTNYTIVKDKK